MYLHRIGRTARAGAPGKAISLVSHDRVDDFARILKKTKQPIQRLNEELGITVPVFQQRPYDRYQRGSSYWDNNRYKNGNNYRYSGNRERYR